MYLIFAVYVHFLQVMPDVMTPDSMVEKLDSFDNVKEGENGPNQADLDVSHLVLSLVPIT